jgi:hypothetical protein
VLELGRKEFVRLSYFETPVQEDTSGAGYGIRGVYMGGDGDLVVATGKTDDVVGATPDQETTGMDSAFVGAFPQEVAYDLIPVVDGETGKDAAITVDASKYVPNGEYGIYAGGVNPTSGGFAVRYAYEGQLPQYKFTAGDNREVLVHTQQDVAKYRNDPDFTQEEKTGKTHKGTIVETSYLPKDNEKWSPLQQEMINNIMNLNPSLYNTMMQLQDQYTGKRLDKIMSSHYSKKGENPQQQTQTN